MYAISHLKMIFVLVCSKQKECNLWYYPSVDVWRQASEFGNDAAQLSVITAIRFVGRQLSLTIVYLSIWLFLTTPMCVTLPTTILIPTLSSWWIINSYWSLFILINQKDVLAVFICMQTDLVMCKRQWPDDGLLRFTTLCASPSRNAIPLLCVGRRDDLSVCQWGANDLSVHFSLNAFCSIYLHCFSLHSPWLSWTQTCRISLVSARVHPVESCSSFCMRGLINAAVHSIVADEGGSTCNQLTILVPML